MLREAQARSEEASQAKRCWQDELPKAVQRFDYEHGSCGDGQAAVHGLGLMGKEFLASPVTVVVALLVAFASSWVYYAGNQEPLIPRRRLLCGYVAVTLSSLVLAATSAYVAPEEAASRWQVSQERYWQVLANHYFTTLILMGSVAIVGLAIVGFPVVVTLGRFRVATIPNVLAASVLISALVAVLLSSHDVTPFQHLARTLVYVIGTHLVLALSFCLGIGLPWRRPLRAHEA